MNYPKRIILGEGNLDPDVKDFTLEIIDTVRGLRPWRNAVAEFIGDDYSGPKYRLVLEKIEE